MTAAKLQLLSGSILLALGLALWLFAASIDHALSAALHLDAASASLSLIRLLTAIGGGAVMIPLVLIVCVLLAARGNRGRALWLFAVVATGRLLVALLKALIGRGRPDLETQLVHVGSASFPSAHSAGTMLTVAGLLIALDARRIWWAALAWPLLIGLTRVMLGVHWPSDVLGGWGVALLWTGLCAWWLPRGGSLGWKDPPASAAPGAHVRD